MRLLLYIGTCLLIALAPGPDICFVLAQSAGLGAWAGLCVTAGLITGLLVHITLAVLGVAAVLNRFPRLADIISALGAVYLFWVAWGMWGATLQTQDAQTLSSADFYLRGILLNLSNPKVILFFIAFIPKFIPAHVTRATHRTAWLLTLGGLFALCAATVMSAAALLGGSLETLLRDTPSAAMWLSRGAALAVVAIALWILFPLARRNNPDTKQAGQKEAGGGRGA